MAVDEHFYATLVEELYAVDDFALSPIHQYIFDWRGVYRVQQPGRESWTLRACKQDGATSWYYKPAAVLNTLQQQQYPAPRIIPTRHNRPVGAAHDWWTFMVTYIEGEPASYTPHDLYLLGSIIGKLHALQQEAAATTPLPIKASWKHPAEALPACFKALDSVEEPMVPSELQPLYTALRTTLANVQKNAPTWPVTLIHGDCWPGNAIRTTQDGMILVDWDGSGFGPAIIDLGSLLLTAHYNQPLDQSIEPATACIAAILEGYSQHYTLSAAEQIALLYAMRFNLAFHGAQSFSSLLIDGWKENLYYQKLTRRFEATQAIAAVAKAYLRK